MTYRTQQFAILVVIGFVFLALTGVVARSQHVFEQHQSSAAKMGKIVRDVFDFNVAAGDYLKGHHDRALEQMGIRLESIPGSLEAVKFKNAEHQAALEDMRREFERARRAFAILKKIHLDYHSKYGGDLSEAVDPFAYMEIEGLSANLSSASMAVASAAHYLLKSSEELQARDVRFYGYLKIGTLLLSFVLLSLSVFLFSQRFVRSIDALKAGTDLIAKGDLGHRFNLGGADEFGELAGAIDSMTESLQQLNDELEKRVLERTAALDEAVLALKESNRELEQFAYVASHDLQEPLRMISSFTQLLAQEYKGRLDAEADEYIHYVVDGANRMQLLIQDLLGYSRVASRGKPFEAVDLNTCWVWFTAACRCRLRRPAQFCCMILYRRSCRIRHKCFSSYRTCSPTRSSSGGRSFPESMCRRR